MRRLAGLLLLGAMCGTSATTTTWELHSYQDFLRGRMSGLSITRDGRLVLGPRVETIFSSDQAQVWSLAQAPDGSVYLGTGNRGRLIRVDANGTGSTVWNADEPAIFALAVDQAGVVYAGTSPDGKIYRIENGRASEYFAPGERYIWALALGPDHALYAATGQRGKIYRITGPAQGAVYYETGQANVTALAFDHEGRLLAGSEPNGILYRVTGNPAKGFVLYDSNLPEIRAITPMEDGTIYAAALGGSVAKRAAAATSTTTTGVTLTAPATSITVTDAQAGVGITPRPSAPAPAAAAIAAPTTTVEVTGVERSALYKISPDNSVETLFSSKDENIYDVLAEPSGTLLLVTDAQGRVYRLDPRSNRSHEATLLAQTNEDDATRLAESPRGVLLAAGSVGKLLRLDNANSGAPAWFESPVHDSGTVARWGRLSMIGAGEGVTFKTRSGNSARPDMTWSDWSQASSGQDGLITSPNARFIQWRAEWSGNGSTLNRSAAIDGVSIAYLPQNSAPTVRSVTVSSQAAKAAAAAASSGNSAAFSITVTDTGDATTAAGTQSTTFSRPAGQQLLVSWQADDPEGDKLSYTLFFRGEGQRDWTQLRADMTDNTFSIDGDTFADGRYFFRVVASDKLSNPLEQAKMSELTSAPVLIDNTPPEVKVSTPRKNGAGFEIDVDAEDRASSLKRAEYSLDAGPWQPVEASDGVTDSPRERFPIRVANFPSGEHMVVVRVVDAAGNAGLAKVMVR